VAGASAEPELSLFQDVYDDEETAEYQDGSARIALILSERFNNFQRESLVDELHVNGSVMLPSR
jgi:hypothetical protein